ncbi:outer membrane beta-barrel family protein [Filimonas effusa]|uniref:TonB-dependent receptor n=1 Tax=Filimonas effusa TaxID=2508721 RepID=A0A4Q1DD61_9BACT|nr:outer membrane beta-barrel family protein [Filimonas effusa]RXK86805.1 TonB-dependent receptor [Filimonas effusa]
MRVLLIALFIGLMQTVVSAQTTKIAVSGSLREAGNKQPVPYVNVYLKIVADSSFITGTITDEKGLFAFSDIKTGSYFLQFERAGYKTVTKELFVGALSNFLDVGAVELSADTASLQAVTVSAKANRDGTGNQMDKKTYTVGNNISQSGGSLLQAMKNLPGITASDDGKIQIRGSDKVVVLVDGKQTALTGFGGQSSLDNIPASSIERIEIINNPSARHDANGAAGIINIIYKKNRQQGLNGKIGFTGGLGALGIKQQNLPGIRPQYQRTPKLNPSLSVNYRKNKLNAFFQGDFLYTQTLNKNEFVDRYYANGDTIRQQTKRNRNTTVATSKAGVDWELDKNNTFTISGLFSSEKIIDRGDQPFFNADLTTKRRLWQFLEDELKTTVTASAIYQHAFVQPGHKLNIAYNYTFHRENEKYFFTNIMPGYTGYDAFKLLSDEQVSDITADYVRPLGHGRIETGLKLRYRTIPTNMKFIPGLNSPLDTTAGGWADYRETIPAVYGSYVYESKKLELEAGIRLEYLDLTYKVNPDHVVYKSDGYHYTEPFPNLRLGYKINEHHKVSLFYNRRVDRPNEVDIRIFPKYDDAEIIKVGNPGLRPQFTNSFEGGYKATWRQGSVYAAAYHRIIDGFIARIATAQPGSTLIYHVFQNAGRSYNSGIETIFEQKLSKRLSLNANGNIYRNTIDAFTVENKYPVPSIYTAEKEQQVSGSFKLNVMLQLPGNTEVQMSSIYQAKDLVPQGEVGARFSIDAGVKRQIQKGRGELFANASDLFNTLRVKRVINGADFKLVGADYYETQVFRVGYSFKF